MKLENPGYGLNERLDKGTICCSFEWKIRLQLSHAYYISAKKDTLKIADTVNVY